MGKNNWEYATLTSGEKLQQIHDGNSSLYHKETKNNDELKKQYLDAGLDTTEIDNWQKQLDAARVPVKYTSSPIVKAAYQRAREARKAVDEVLKQAKAASASIDESFANRGMQRSGNSYTEQKNQLKQQFLDAIQSIDESYGQKFSSRYKQIADRMFK